MTLDLVEMVHKINHEVLVPSFLEDFVFQLKFFSLFLTSGFNVIIMLLLCHLEVIGNHFKTKITAHIDISDGCWGQYMMGICLRCW